MLSLLQSDRNYLWKCWLIFFFLKSFLMANNPQIWQLVTSLMCPEKRYSHTLCVWKILDQTWPDLQFHLADLILVLNQLKWRRNIFREKKLNEYWVITAKESFDKRIRTFYSIFSSPSLISFKLISSMLPPPCVSFRTRSSIVRYWPVTSIELQYQINQQDQMAG